MKHLTWCRSSYSSGQGGNCLEIANLANGGRAVRDSKDPTGPALTFTAAAWSAFNTAIRTGEFD
ncbi:MAG TPA: DUF397 domain-containing protein [Pseudonocardiaceae bacterium]